jgi:hypothetical protein
MNKIDLIIDALENSKPINKESSIPFDKHLKALAAAHELKALKPVGTFAYDPENEVWEQLVENVAGVELYAIKEQA